MTIFLNFFQFSSHLKDLYLLRSLLQLVFHQLLECFIILTILEYLAYILSVVWAIDWMAFLSESISEILSVLIDLSTLMSLLTKFFSLLLSLTIIHYLVWICSSNIEMVTISVAWSETSLYLEYIECLLSSSDPYLRNIMLQSQVLRVKQVNKPCIGLTQENSIENSV